MDTTSFLKSKNINSDLLSTSIIQIDGINIGVIVATDGTGYSLGALLTQYYQLKRQDDDDNDRFANQGTL